MTLNCVVKSDKINLREYQPQDADALFLLMSDPENSKFIAYTPHKCIEETRNSFEGHANCGYYFIMTLNDSDRAIGFVGVDQDGSHPGEGKIGYLMDKKYWGNGYTPAAVRLVTEYILKNTGIKSIYATIKPENTKSQRCVEKAGYILEKKLENYISSAADDSSRVRLVYRSAIL